MLGEVCGSFVSEGSPEEVHREFLLGRETKMGKATSLVRVGVSLLSRSSLPWRVRVCHWMVDVDLWFSCCISSMELAASNSSSEDEQQQRATNSIFSSSALQLSIAAGEIEHDSDLKHGDGEIDYSGEIQSFQVVSDYKQTLQFQSLNEGKRNIHMEVCRGGRTIKNSIFDIVLVTGHSLAIDESSMTGESKIVHKTPKTPFLMFGCEVAYASTSGSWEQATINDHYLILIRTGVMLAVGGSVVAAGGVLGGVLAINSRGEP
ncbi:hypothetical protein Dimus_015382 [Dionaea muscipula]